MCRESGDRLSFPNPILVDVSHRNPPAAHVHAGSLGDGLASKGAMSYGESTLGLELGRGKRRGVPYISVTPKVFPETRLGLVIDAATYAQLLGVLRHLRRRT